MAWLRKVRVEVALFFVLFVAYGYFHQGGGWNQNSRFAQVRSIVEAHTFEIGGYLTYEMVSTRDGQRRLQRVKVPSTIEVDEIAGTASTGDIAVFDGRIYPNKPPGTVLAAVPVYAVLYAVERILEMDADDWWLLTLNVYLTTVFSVALVAAFGCIAFYRVSLRLFPWVTAWAHATSTLTFGLGTLILPFATMLFDHSLVVSLSLFSFLLLLLGKETASSRGAWIFGTSGFLCGLMVVANYSAVIGVLGLSFYAASVAPGWKRLTWFASGLVLPLFFLAGYHQRCFGSIFATANTYQHAMFRVQGPSLLGMFQWPRLDVALQLLFSSYRGLFFTSPVLVFALVGMGLMLRQKQLWSELALFVFIFLGFFAMNSAMTHWHAGASIGPRYLIPALPFLSLPLAAVLARWPRSTLSLAFFSMAIMLLVTAVDPQPYTQIRRPLGQYIVPLFQGRTLVANQIRIQGPVSANPIGNFESWFRPVLHHEAPERAWNSFNLGEFFWPHSVKSLFPLVALLLVGSGFVFYWGLRANQRR